MKLGYKYSDFIKCGKFFDCLQKLTLLSDSAPWSFLGNFVILDPSVVTSSLLSTLSTTDLLHFIEKLIHYSHLFVNIFKVSMRDHNKMTIFCYECYPFSVLRMIFEDTEFRLNLPMRGKINFYLLISPVDLP